MLPQGLTIRPMAAEDYDAVVDLWRIGDLPFRPTGRDSREEIERQLTEPSSVYLVATAGPAVVGAVLGTHDGRKGWINRVAVHPKWRGIGVAVALVEEVERRFRSYGIGVYAALIEKHSSASRSTFLKMGYRRLDHIQYFAKKVRDDM